MIVYSYSDINKDDTSLRPYQQKAKKEIFESWDEVDNVMFQMPTGTGKTRLFTSIIKDINEYSKLRREPVKILIIAHRTELIDQIDESLDKYKVPHNVIAGGRDRNYKYPVNVASIQTITHPNNLKDAKKLNVQFIIIDEAHHALAATYKKLWKMYPESKKLGVTATPWRMNHQSFLDLFDKLVLSMSVKDFIKQGYLAPYKYFSLKNDSDIQRTIDDIELDRFGEYKESSMEEKMDIGSIRAQLLNSYLSLAEGKKGIIYAININHAKHICKEYEKAGYNAVSIDSKTPAGMRKELVERFKKNEIDIIVNVDIFSEGFDCPDIEFIQLARPTRSLVKYLQQVGRGLRTTTNKQNCVILDNVGMYSRFGLPDARRHWKFHFLGKKVDEEPVRVVLKGTGKSRYVNTSEGTEDMVLIQDINEEVEIADVSNQSNSAIDVFFPLFGVTLGKTTIDQAVVDLGGEYKVDEDTGELYLDVENIHFDDLHIQGTVTDIYWTKDYRDFPDSWKSKGFSWEKTYDEWLDVFRRLGFKIEEDYMPVPDIYGRSYIDALSPDGRLSFQLRFMYGKDGYQTSSPNALDSVYVSYHKLPIKSLTDDTEEEDVKDETFNPIRLLENKHFICDNFIFFFKQSKKIYEAYIQDDKYYIISELIIDEDNQCVHRKRVGKIQSDSWMYWQMLREKIDNLRSITHYGANFTVFHYRVLSSETKTEKDKFFDYKGREIDSPDAVVEKYEQAVKDGGQHDYIDVPVSKASFKVVLQNSWYTLFRTVKGVTKPIAKMLSTSNFGFSYELEVALDNVERKSKGLPQIRLHNTDRICVIRSDENSFTIKKVEKGKGYLLKYNLEGKLLHTSTIASTTVIKSNLLKADDIEKLKHAFDKKSTSYRYFWIMSLLQIYKETQVANISYREILVRMVANAWKYVFLLNGKFPPSDQLPIYLFDLQKNTKLHNYSTESEIEGELNTNFETLKSKSQFSSLLKNVPYRFLSPWIPFTSNDDVMKRSWSPESRCPYELYSDHVVITELWRNTLVDYYDTIMLLVEYGLESYLKIKQNDKEAHDFYNTRFATLNQLLKGIKRRRRNKDVQLFLSKFNFPLSGEITPADIMKIMPESQCVIDSDGRKRVNVPGNLWSLKILDKKLSDENLMDTYENVQLLADYGLEAFQELNQKKKEIKDIYNAKFISLTKLLRGIKSNKDENVVKEFLRKFSFPPSGEITPADIMKIVPDSKCVLDSDGRKRINVPGGMWSLKELDKLLEG